MNDLIGLQTFVAIARAGSFAEAARRLRLSPAMVGRRVQALEDHYGTRLVERTTRSLRLTDQGQKFLTKAIQIVEAVENLSEIGHSDDGPLRGRVRISAPTTLGTKKLAGIVAGVVERSPELSVELSLSDRRVDLVTEGYDLAVRVGNLKSSGLIARRIGTYRFVCCASPAFLRRHGAPGEPSGLARMRCILNANLQAPDQWSFVTKARRSISVEVSGSMELNYDEAHRIAALNGAGFIYVPLHLVAEDLRSGKLVEVLAKWGKPEMPIHIIRASRHFVPRRVAALIDAIADGLRDKDKI